MIRLARFLLSFTGLLTCDWEATRWEIDGVIDGRHPVAEGKLCGIDGSEFDRFGLDVYFELHNPYSLRLNERNTYWWTRVGGEARWDWERQRWEIVSIKYVK